MTRLKRKPQISKPDFAVNVARGGEVSRDLSADTSLPCGEVAKRLPVTLQLKREIIARLEHEAARKEKSMAQVIEKLVAKHLDKA